jgi:hypothetical protein
METLVWYKCVTQNIQNIFSEIANQSQVGSNLNTAISHSA